MRRLGLPLRFLVALLALAAIGAALWQLERAKADLIITHASVGHIPVTVFRAPATTRAPVVVIAHGFAGSQQLMQPFAQTFSHNGYIAVTFDFTGHGRNPETMKGDVDEPTKITGKLVDDLGRVTDFARALPQSDGRAAVLGHSMASDIVVQYGVEHPDISATIAVSVFTKKATATLPRDLLVIVGNLEPQVLKDEGLRVVNLAAGGGAVPGRTYGDFAAGTARRLVLSSGVEHIGVLYSQDSMRESLAWLNDAFGRSSFGWIDGRPIWLGLLFGGLIALAWPLSKLLPRAAPVPMGASSTWPQLLAAALIPAVLTPLVLWKAPTDFLIILLGDYLTLHFLLYGLLTAAILILIQRRAQRHLSPHHQHGRTKLDTLADPAHPKIALAALAIASIAAILYNIVAIGLPLNEYVFAFDPIAPRIPLIAAVACGTIPYFVTAEWMAHGAGARRGAYALAKFCFLASLAAAVALNLHKLFFLIIIVPAILLLFIAFGLISNWTYKATNHPLPGALANAVLFAWAIAVTFPMVVT